MREPLGDPGLPVRGPTVNAGPLRVVYRLVGVHRSVAHPAPPAVALSHIIKETHPSKLACPTTTPRTRASVTSRAVIHAVAARMERMDWRMRVLGDQLADMKKSMDLLRRKLPER